ncbi:MAG: ATP-binding protein [Nitrospirae bacterium YQR-1]
MKIKVKNLGVLRQAEFELGDLTIICGKNNTGKTYATYALFGFLSFWRSVFKIDIPAEFVERLMKDGAADIDLEYFVRKAPDIVKQGCLDYIKHLPNVFASSEKNFSDASFLINIDVNDVNLKKSFERTISSSNNKLFAISKQADDSKFLISLLVDKDDVKVPSQIISQIIGDAVKEILFSSLFPNVFIASAERTGAAIFRKELNFARNRILEEISSKGIEIDPFDLLTKAYSDYPLPVKDNVDFTRQLEEISKKDSFITRQHPDILSDFGNIIGGSYSVTKNEELFFIPKVNKRLKLTMDASSSAVRSLLDIGFYLRHVAKENDLLMIDEPELNLHPENQRRVARLLARLVNTGIKVFLTTHSDYIIKELNTLIMLNHDKTHLKHIMESEGYKKEEMISPYKVRVYIAEEALVNIDGCSRRSKCLTFVPADIDPELGIEVRSFDTTINEMNRIQEAIYFGGGDSE